MAEESLEMMRRFYGVEHLSDQIVLPVLIDAMGPMVSQPRWQRLLITCLSRSGRRDYLRQADARHHCAAVDGGYLHFR